MQWERSSGRIAATDPLLAPKLLTKPASPDPRRWWMLFLFCWLSASNAIVSMSFSSVPIEAKLAYPGLTDHGIDLLLMWSAILPVAAMLPTIWLLTMPGGVEICIKLGAVLISAGSFVRIIPSMMSLEERFAYQTLVLCLLHSGQIINACAYPLFMASPSQLSATYFPATQRNTVTAVAVIFCEIGYAIAFYIPSWTVDIHNILLYELLLTVGALVAASTLFFFPTTTTKEHTHSSSSSFAEFKHEVVTALSNRRFVVVALTMGICGGVWTGWCPDIADALTPPFSEEEGDMLSLVANVATIVGGTLIGPIADLCFPNDLKKPMIIMMMICLVAFTWFTIALPTPSQYLNHAPELKELRHMKFNERTVPVTIAGLMEGATVPMAYEFCSQLLAPLSEGTSGGVYQLFVNCGQLLFLLVPIIFKTNHWYNFWCLTSIVVGLVGLLFGPRAIQKNVEPKNYGTMNEDGA